MKVRKKKGDQKSSEKKRKHKKRLKRIFKCIKFLLTFGILSATVVYASMLPYFSVNTFRVRGSAHYTDQFLASASGISGGENGFRLLFDEPGRFYLFRIGKAERAIIEKCPYVKKVKVRYLIPSTIAIDVEERTAAAILSIQGTSLLIDEQGYLLEIDPEREISGIPVIKGIKPDSFRLGKKVDMPEDVLSSAFKLYDTIKETDDKNEKKLLPDIDYIDVGDLNNVKFSLQSRIVVNLGELDDLNYKISTVRTILNNNIKENERGRLDFYPEGNPVFSPEIGG